MTLQLRWFHRFQFAGYYAAVEKGFYADEGLDVRLKVFEEGMDPVVSVLTGKADYGVGDTRLLVERMKGEPVVVLKQVFQHSPLVLLSLKESGIVTPYDMAGKKVMLFPGEDASLLAMLQFAPEGPDQVTVLEHSYLPEDLITGKVDVMSAYVTDEPFLFKSRGVDVNIINPVDYNIDFYGDNLFTTQRETEAHPERVEKMVRATLKGWEYALANPDEMIDLIRERYGSGRTREQLAYEAQLTRVMIQPEFTPLGTVTRTRYVSIADVYQRAGKIRGSFDLKGFLRYSPVGEGARWGGLPLTTQERAWLSEHPKLRVGVMNAWPPMNYLDAQGVPRGIGMDYLHVLNRRLGGILEVVPGPFKKNMAAVMSGELDALMDITPKKEREAFFEFTSPYLTTPQVIVGKRDGPYFEGEESLRGKSVALETSYFTIAKFQREEPTIRVREYPTTSDCLDAVSRGEVDAYVGNRAVAVHLLEKEVMTNLKVMGRTTEAPVPLAIGVRKDRPVLRGILDKALASVSRSEIRGIHQKWMTEPVSRTLEQEVNAGHIEQMLGFTLLILALLTLSMWVLLRQAGNVFPEVFRTYGLQAVGVVAGTVLVAAVISYAWFGIRDLEKRIRQGMGSSLSIVLTATHAALTESIEGQKEHVEEYARDPRLVALAKQLVMSPRTRDSLLKSKPLKALRTYFRSTGSSHWQEGFFIIAKDYTNIASMRDENIGWTNLIAEQRPDLMAAAFSGSTVFVPPIRTDVPLLKGGKERLATSFIAAPLKNADGSVFAVVTRRLDPSEEFTRLCQIGLIGKTGETYAFDRDGFLLSRSRFENELVQLGILPPENSSVLTVRVSDPMADLRKGGGTTGPEQDQALTRMASSAISGDSGVDVAGYRDYRGVRVLGAWLWSEDLQVGMAAEIDEEEVLTTYRANRRVVVSVIGFTMLLMTLLSGFVFLNVEQTQRNLKKARDDWESVAEERHEELQRREKKFRGIFDQSVQLMTILDTSGRIMEVNQMALDMTGTKPEALLGTLFWDGPWWAHSPDLQGKVLGAVRDAAAGEQVGFEVTHLDTRGRAHFVDFTMIPVMDEEDRIISLLSMGNDITDRKRAEENLRASETFLQSVLDGISAHIAVLGVNGTILAVNAAWREFAIANGGSEEDGGIGTNYLEVCRMASGPESEDATRVYEGTLEVIRGGRQHFFTTYPCHSPVERRWFSLRVNRLDQTGPSRVVVAHENVTEIKAAEEALRLNEERLESLLQLSQGRWDSEQELSDFALEQGVRLTRSKVGYLHFYDEEMKSLTLNSWSREVLKGCDMEATTHYPLEKAGVWADSVRERRAVIHNDYRGMCGGNGLPQGHFELIRHMSIPIFDGEHIVGVAGVGNKGDFYDESDTRQLNLFVNNLMVILKQRRAEEALSMRAKWAEGLHKAGIEFSRCETIEEVAAVARRATVQYLPLSMACIGLPDGTGDIHPFPQDEEASRLWVGRCPCQAKVMETGEPVVVPDIQGAPLFDGCRESGQIHDFGSCASFPLFAGEACVGIFTIRSQERGKASILPQITPLIETLVGQVGHVWQRCEADMQRRRHTEELRASNEALDHAKDEALQLMEDATGQRTRAEEALARLADSQGELAREREQLQKILETSPVGVGISVDEVVQWLNPRFSEITNLGVGDSTHQMYLNVEDRHQVRTEIQTKGIVRDLELTVHGHNGCPLDVLSTFYSVEYEGQKAILGWLIDITERKQMELEIMAARDKAEEATRAKSHFLANMSHEIRTPMNSILGFLELALEGTSLPDNVHQYLSIAFSSAKGLLSLINDILDISKLESGKLEIEEEPFHLATVMNQTCEIMNVKAREKGLTMHLEIHPALSGSFLGDALRLKQILINLIGNAIKFTEEGEVIVSVKPVGEGKTLQFAVSDTGIGIAAKRLTQIFEPFSQADSSITRRFGGTGLGTTISNQLVELMNGKIWVESTEGKGSTFYFTIDLRRVDRFQAGGDGREEGNAILREPKRCFRVLLVEDVEANVKLATIRLEEQGHEVRVAWDGREAVESVRQDSFDLILMDIQMPVMDGLEATRRIREMEAGAERSVPIIAMTASVTKEEREEDLEAGMDAVVSKPIDFGHLFKVMEDVVPQGWGTPMVRGGADGKNPDVSGVPTLNGVDVKQGVSTWRDRDAFFDALRSFAERYGKVTETLEGHLQSGELDEARQLIHTLKGVAGNLSMVDVFAISEEMNALMTDGRFDEAKGRLGALADAFHAVIASIKSAGPLTKPEEGPTKELNLPELTRLFGEMLEALELYSPSAVEPCLTELRSYLTASQLRPVQVELERFDFDEARMKALSLAERLGIHVVGAGGDDETKNSDR
ncbi:hypothetical protein DSLASN_23430 [Desulfoluna limicola]|uniref:histidine kinase n=1 Tax=Desulfoluna limicola TaxID=2810562 RepID=A0ABM7PGL8_9BACT|nr:hypothetical protein DSLASN_23430 [Desulfoluna limicola]